MSEVARGAASAKPVPRSQAERIGRLGAMLAGIAGDAALEALRRAARRSEGEGSLLLTEANAERVTATLAELRGAAMKLGQLISLQGEDLLPAELGEILASLRSRAYAMPPEEVEEVLTRELGRKRRAQLAELDPEPLAAASIGQVHAALAADGRDLALKIQYPGVAESIEADVASLLTLLRISRLLPPHFELEALAPELIRELHCEADYRRERRAAERYRALVAQDERLWVPEVHPDLSTGAVLALDRVRGLPVEDLRGAEHPDARRNALAGALVELVFRELFEFRFMQTDPNFANYLYEPKGERIALLDFGSTREFPERFTRGYADLIRASVEGDSGDVVSSAVRLGFLRSDEGAESRESFLRIARLFAEPLRCEGAYDFRRSDLARRLRDASIEPVRLGLLTRPPTPTLFLHRKLAGVFLLCSHVGAEVDCRTLYRSRLV